MKRYLTFGIIFGVLVIAIVIISWFGFPAWRDPASGGFWTLLGATLLGVLTVMQGAVSIWRDLREEKKEEPKPLAASQKAHTIYNVSGRTVNFVQPMNPVVAEESTIDTPDLSDTEAEQDEEIESPPNTVIDGLNWENASSSIIFDGRLHDAFPGLRGIEKLQGEEAVDRLLILLRDPLYVELGKFGRGRISPFWWFRGRTNLFINEFERLYVDRVLMDVYDMKIDYIVGVRAFNAEERNFVYVQVLPDKPTGLYKYSEGQIADYLQNSLERNWGYYIQEEYGVWHDRFITRAEYDDAAAMIDGKPTDTRDAKLRVRYLTPYNFVICGQQHVLNNTGKIDMQTTKLMDEILLETKTVDDLVDFVENLQPSTRFRI